MADVGLTGEAFECIAVVVRRRVAGMEQAAQYSPFGIAPVVTVTYEGVFAERLQDTDQCFRSVDAVKLFRHALQFVRLARVGLDVAVRPCPGSSAPHRHDRHASGPRRTP